MKDLDPATEAELYGYACHRAAELYTIFFPEGTVYWTSRDANVVANGHTFLASAALPNKVRILCEVGTSVDELILEFAPGTQTLGGVAMVAAALAGSCAGIRVVIERAYLDASGVLIGATVVLFDGTVDYPETTSDLVKLHVVSSAGKLSREIPFRRIQAGCQWQIFDANCGLDPAPYTNSRTTSTGCTADTLQLTTSVPFLGAGHLVTITSGSMSGAVRRSRSMSGTGGPPGTVVLDRPLPSAPPAGVTLTLRHACNGVRTSCRDVFGNLAKFSGMPDVPTEEVA